VAAACRPSSARRPLRRLVGPALILLALGAAACGGDEERERAPAPPELTVPGDTQTAPAEPQTTTTPPQAPPTTPPADTGSGGGGQTAPAPPAEDSPQNDVPPRPGTPESRFERFCRQNPGACG
jgi:hypothetical protein